MSNAYEKVKKFIERHSMLESTSDILVAVSGGPDSVALLDMLLRLRLGDRPQGAGYRDEESAMIENDNASGPVPCPLSPVPFIHVAHFDHQLRGVESAEDAQFVERFARSQNLRVSIGSADVRAKAEELGQGIEETARELRYKFLLATAQAAGCDRIATGHTMSDQAETFLMRLARGAGLRGLACMRPSRPLTTDFRPLLIRPLLCITREEVEEYCRERRLEFRTDPTNASVEYARNRVRNEALPALRRINRGVVENISSAAEIIAESEAALDYAASAFLDKARVGSAKGTNRSKMNIEVQAYSVPELLAQPAGLRRRVIFEAISRARHADELKRTDRAQITSAHVASVEKLLEEKASGNRAQLPGGLEVWREFDAIVFKSTALPAMVEPPAGVCEMDSNRTQAESGGLSITVERGITGQLLDETIKRAGREKEEQGRDWSVVALDDALLPDRLVVRPRRAGETARVLGHRRTIKLKNLMISHKIPASRRNVWPIIVTPDGRYVWSPGLPPAVEFAASGRSEKLAILRASGF